MKSLQITAPGRCEIVDRPEPKSKPHEVVVRVLAVTTCPHWDMHIFGGVPMFEGMKLTYPYEAGQPGHEACGEIVAIGSDVKGLSIGQRVAVWRDQGHDRPGCYAEYVAADAVNVLPVPDTLQPAAVAPLELAMCVSAHVMFAEKLDAIAGKRVGVMGLGPAGLVCVQLLRDAGAKAVVGFDPVPARRKLAESMGADTVLDPASAEAQSFPARGEAGCLNTAFDCVGKAAVVEHALDISSRLVVLFAVQREPYTFSPRHWPGLTLAGTQPHTREAAEYALARVEAGQLNLAPLVTHTFPFADYAQAVELLKKGEALKVAFAPQDGWR